MVILEALSHGVAVIATPVGAIPEVIEDGCNGILAPPRDVESLARSIERLIVDAELRRSLGAAARRTHADRYQFEKYVFRLAEIWNDSCR
jgi:glycosyltransferase involved in cell wall biosynthesis